MGLWWQKISLDLPHGWLRRFATKAGSFSLMHSKPECWDDKVSHRERVHSQGSQGGDRRTSLRSTAPKAKRAQVIDGITNKAEWPKVWEAWGKVAWERWLGKGALIIVLHRCNSATNLCAFEESYDPLWAPLVGQMVKNLPAVWEMPVQSLGQEDPL